MSITCQNRIKNKWKSNSLSQQENPHGCMYRRRLTISSKKQKKKNSYFSYLTIWQFESRLYPFSSPIDGTRMRFLEIPPAQSWRQRALPSPVRLCTGGDCCSCCRWQRRDQSHSGERLGAGSSSAGSRMCQRASSELNILFHSPSVPVWVEGEAAGNKTPKIVLCITHTHTVEQ